MQRIVNMKILVLGSGAREHALVWKLAQNPTVTLYNYGSTNNPGIAKLCKVVQLGSVTDISSIVDFSQHQAIDIVWVGPEAPLEAGVVDALEGVGIDCIGPTKLLAQLESSKSFTRDLLKKYNINVSPGFSIFTSMEGIAEFMQELQGNVVVKPDGLTGGKGVRVMGDHFHSVAEALAYCEELFASGDPQVLIEEKLIGQEFSLMSFADGKNLIHMPLVQDHKRVFVGDKGPNTGGMGSYTMPDHSLPFVTADDLARAKEVNQEVLDALAKEFNQEYKGIMYGNFIAVNDGIRIIEYNARFGDPEAMNLLSLLKTDLLEITKAIINRDLDQLQVEFESKASVCKYVVPDGYPDSPVEDQPVDMSQVDTSAVNLFYGSVDQTEQGLIEKGSRTASVTAVADTLEEAEKIAEAEVKKITGPVFHREDIGTAELIEQRITMMKQVRE